MDTEKHPLPYRYNNCDCQQEVLSYLKHELKTVNWNTEKHGENYERKAHKEFLKYHIAMEDLTSGLDCT